jgi:radical SAM protein with 4Fe4S-binding SPASM domain
MPVTAGNVRRADPIEIYRQAPLFRSLREADAFGGRCGACSYHALCGGSRARAWSSSGDPLVEDPLCLYG